VHYKRDLLFVLTQKVTKKSRTDDMQHIGSFALMWLCSVAFATVEP